METNLDKTKSVLLELLPYLIILLVVILLKIFIITTVKVNGPSMENNLMPNDIILLDKISYKFTNIKRFDVVVIKYGNEKIIKRVIGLPGEHIKYEDNQLYVNDKKVEDKYNNGKTADFDLNYLYLETIPKDCYLVLGDNRGISLDGRKIGVIKKKDIIGKAMFTIFPFNHFGKVK